MLTNKTRYYVLALIYLAGEYGKGPILSSVIASKEKIPQRFLEVLLAEMKSLGFLGSKPGKGGGYFLMKDPAEISLFDILEFSEGTLSWVPCVSEKSYQVCEFCKDESLCKIRKVYNELREHNYHVLKNTSLKDLIK
jgi:Rrf2 family protein